jgi:hypothetical protein
MQPKERKMNFEISAKTEVALAEKQDWNQKSEIKECEFTSNANAGLAEYIVCNQLNEKRNFEILTKTKESNASTNLSPPGGLVKPIGKDKITKSRLWKFKCLS